MESYNIGNQKFTSGNIEEALRYYSEGIHFVTVETNPSDELKFLKLKLYLNRAMCFLKSRDYDEAVRDCSEVVAFKSELEENLPMDSQCWSMIYCKALIRRAIAYEYLGCFTKGMTDLDEVLSTHLMKPVDKCLIKYAKDLKQRLMNLSALDRKVAAAEGKPPRLVSDSQSLRLSLMNVLPDFTNKESSFNVKLCITNEMGLWDHSLLEAKSSECAAAMDTTWNRVKCSALFYSNSRFNSHPSFEVIVVHPSKLVDKSAALLNSNGKAEFTIRLREIAACHDISLEAVMFRFELAGALPSGAIVQPLLSLPITFQQSPDISGTVHSHTNFNCVREVAVRTSEEDTATIYVFESGGFLGIGGKVWDSSYVLLDYLTDARDDLMVGSVVVELGSGTGITGLAASLLGAERVYMTDLPDVVPLLKSNIALNTTTAANVFALRYRWGDQDDLTELSNAIYSECICRLVIIASDVVYTPEAYEPLLHSIRSLLQFKIVDSRGNRVLPVLILSHRHRHPDDGQFFQSLADSPDVEVVDLTYQSDRARGCHESEDVRVLRITPI